MATEVTFPIMEPMTDRELLRLARPAGEITTDDGRIVLVRSWKVTMGPDRVPTITIEGFMRRGLEGDTDEKPNVS